MPTPNLLHPVQVIVQPIDRAATLQDDDFREPIQNAARGADVAINGQVKWEEDEGERPAKTGPGAASRGYVLFRYRDLDRLGLVLKQGDRIARIGRLETDVYIVRLVPMGHWHDVGKATLLKAYFADRHPSRQSRGRLVEDD